MKSPFLESLRNLIRVKHYSIRTEKTYVGWVVKYIKYHNNQHPSVLGANHIGEYLTYLAVSARVAPNTQAQALNALMFMYKHLLGTDLSDKVNFTRSKRKQKIPVFLERDEIDSVITRLKGTSYLLGCLMYGSGLRVMEATRLRYHDVDLIRLCLYIREAKGQKMRTVTLS